MLQFSLELMLPREERLFRALDVVCGVLFLVEVVVVVPVVPVVAVVPFVALFSF